MIKATAELLACTEAHSVLLADAEAVAAAERVGLLLRLTTPLPGDEPTQLLIPKAVFSSIEQDGIRACATSPTQPDTAQLLRRRVQSLRDRKLLSLIGEKEQTTAALLPSLLDCRPQLLVLCGKRATLNAIPRTEGLTRGLLTRDGSVAWVPDAPTAASERPIILWGRERDSVRAASADASATAQDLPPAAAQAPHALPVRMLPGDFARCLDGWAIVADVYKAELPVLELLAEELAPLIREGRASLSVPISSLRAVDERVKSLSLETMQEQWQAFRQRLHQLAAAGLLSLEDGELTAVELTRRRHASWQGPTLLITPRRRDLLQLTDLREVKLYHPAPSNSLCLISEPPRDTPPPEQASPGTSRESQPTEQTSTEWAISPEMAKLLKGAQLVIDESALLHPLMPKLMAQLEASIRKGETKLRMPAACRLALTHAKELALYEKRMQMWKLLIAMRGGEHQEMAALLAQMQGSLQGTRMVVLSQKPEGLACARRLGMACVCFDEKGLLRLRDGSNAAPTASSEAAKPALQQMSPAPTQAQHGTNEDGLKVLKRRGLEVCLRLPLKPEKLREHLKGCRVYIDTCSLLHPSAPLLIELLAGLHREGVLRLAIPFCCLQELGRKMREDSDLLKRGVNVMLQTFREDDGGLVYPKVPLKSGEPADNVLQVSMMQERIVSDVALVTQDGDLQNDVLGLNRQESVKKAAHRVRVFRLEKPQKTDYLAELRRASDKP